MKKVFVVGGAAMDITGVPENLCRLRDSNIGKVSLGVGGVGKNISKSLTAYPDLSVELITVLGNDFRADMIEEACREAGIGLAHALRTEGHGATYLCVMDEDGDLLCGISDMDIIEKLTPAYLCEKLELLNSADLVVLDANLPPESLAYLCENLTVPIFYEPVSCAKGGRIGEHIGKCYAIKPNRFEAAYLSGCSCDTVRGVYRASDWFLEQGVQRVFISMGAEGVYWADKDGCGVLAAECTGVVNTTGAGDAMCAAIVNGCITGLTTEECAKNGNHASALVCTRQ